MTILQELFNQSWAFKGCVPHPYEPHPPATLCRADLRVQSNFIQPLKKPGSLLGISLLLDHNKSKAGGFIRTLTMTGVFLPTWKCPSRTEKEPPHGLTPCFLSQAHDIG